MSSPTKPRTPRLYHAGDDAPAATTALKVTACAIVVFLVAGIFVPPEIVVVVAQLSAALMVVALVPSRRRLGLVRPRARYLAAAAMVGISMWYVNLNVVVALGLDQTSPRLEAVVHQPSLALVLLTIALLPAICEELIFRGVLARGLATAMPWPLAAVSSAAVFSLFHMSIVQAVPTFLLGIALGIIATRARSVFPTMLAHAINNAVAITLSRDDFSGAADAITSNPEVALGAGVALTVTGLALAIA